MANKTQGEGLSPAWCFPYEATALLQRKYQDRRGPQELLFWCWVQLLCLMCPGHSAGHIFTVGRGHRVQCCPGKRWGFQTAQVVLSRRTGWGAKELMRFSAAGAKAAWPRPCSHWSRAQTLRCRTPHSASRLVPAAPRDTQMDPVLLPKEQGWQVPAWDEAARPGAAHRNRFNPLLPSLRLNPCIVPSAGLDSACRSL